MRRAWWGVMLVLAGFALAAVAWTWESGDLSGLTVGERFERGADWETFVGELGSAGSAWRELYDGADATVAGEIEALRGVGGPWRLLVVSEPWCGDSRNTVPYLARVADETENVELRLIGKADAPDLLAAHSLPDGREAIPLVLVLDASDRVRGTWVEQPTELRALIAREREVGRREDLVAAIRAWYAADRGRSATAEVVALIRASASGFEAGSTGVEPRVDDGFPEVAGEPCLR